MKKLLFIMIIFFSISCNQTYYITPSGKKVTERKFDRVTERAIKKSLRKLTNEERQSLEGLKFEVVIDSTSN
jgi:hypothetical protein